MTKATSSPVHANHDEPLVKNVVSLYGAWCLAGLRQTDEVGGVSDARAAFQRSVGLWSGCGRILISGRRIGQDRAEVGNIRRREALINRMNGVAGVSDAGFCLEDGNTIASKLGRDRNAGAIKRRRRPLLTCASMLLK